MGSVGLQLRRADPSDIETLASLNLLLIRDEGHRNPMNQAQLAARMRDWLAGEYIAILFQRDQQIVGYALFREDADTTYLRQFFIAREYRRQGIGSEAFRLLASQWMTGKDKIRLDVLSNNVIGQQFWRALGFRDYCVTMELPKPR